MFSMSRIKKVQTVETELLGRGIAEAIDRDRLQRRLDQGDLLRVKLGIDPTGARLHLGHAVPLRVLRRFQDIGHTAVLIIGDFTARVGDPSGKKETRPPLAESEIKENYRTYERQAFRILDKKMTEVRWQTEWYGNMSLDTFLHEVSKISAGWVYSHETFRERLQSGQPLALHETLYPVLQAHDSIAVQADVEIGGIDQKFNLLTGRELMRAHGMAPQDVILTKYLVGTDGQKMGKSLDNFIALEEEPFEMFGKIMSLPDVALRNYYELATDIPIAELPAESITDTAARDAKLRLAETIVGMYHGKSVADDAKKSWNTFLSDAVHVGSVKLHDVPTGSLLELLVVVRVVKSKSEAQRLIEQGGVKVNGMTNKDWGTILHVGDAVTIGKKKQTHTIT